MEISYQGTALNPSLGERGRSSGFLSFTDRSILFKNEAIEKELPLEGLKINIGSGGIKLYYFTHESEPDWSFYTSDKTILKNQILKETHELAKHVKKINIKNNKSKAFIISIPIIVLFLIIGLYLLKTPLVNAIAASIPIEWEIKLGDLAFKQYKVSVEMIDSDKTEKILSELTTPLVKSIKDNRYPFKFHIAKDPTLNAFALPGGNVVINSGLIESASSTNEVLGVIAHEIAHVQKRHGIKQMVNSLGLYLIIQTFFGDITGIAAVLLDNANILITKKFSRNDEREADNTGFEYIIASNINPEGLLSFFKKLEEKENLDKMLPENKGKKGTTKEILDKFEKMLAIYSTHPVMSERINSLEKKIKKIDKKIVYKTGSVSIEQLKEICD